MAAILLTKASVSQLEKEINKRKAKILSDLEGEKNSIEAKIKIISRKEKIEILSKKSSSKKHSKKFMNKGRAVNKLSLKDRLVSIASDGQVRTNQEYVDALVNNGWKTSSEKPYYIVAAELANQNNKGLFRRVKEGSYQLVETSFTK